MMENLLKNEFTTHYALPVSTIADITINTNELYFEIEDNRDSENIVLHTTPHNGEARYYNPQQLSITIINYDRFFTNLSHAFQKGKKRCDLIVYSNNNEYFLLNELKEKSDRDDVRQNATKQLLESLKTIIAIKSIQDFIDRYIIKQCCIFSRQPIGISTQIKATISAFNRLSTLSSKGYKMSNKEIEDLGFELWEFSGSQTYLLEDGVSKIQGIAQQLTRLSTKEVKELTEILKS
ncbi:hypothetical protein FACS1894155_08600 [Bacteroidia bacterium]|nr:hypothetical protein FACS1894155_08600 [Bacteroidia bacterium]